MTGRVFDVQRFSVHDGPGIRTTVFMKGCPLRCGWCHNPEGISGAIQPQFTPEECIGCGSCGGNHSLTGAKSCPTGALKAVGRDVTVEELMDEVLADRDFYGEDGGVTFSGGECLLQAEFVTEMLRRVRKENITTAVDTCGLVPWEAIQMTLPYTNTYLYDLKCLDEEIHRFFTGHDNRLILEDLEKLAKSGANLWIRIPVIPDFNDNVGEMAAMAALVRNTSGVSRVTLMPYHTLGKSKYATLGMTPGYETEKTIPQSRLLEFKDIFRKYGLPVE
ncbi:MAG: glycyl-radical enzyme activating protein [Clostridia bacterium]|nr:glycyl-radical enzyme activating protein [Clostridia bacterium]